MRAALLAALSLLMGSCNKVPIYGVEAGFTVSDAAWFEEEETLFVFWEVSAEQGIADPSVMEITYATDDERVDWTRIEDIPTVHAHEAVDCGVNAQCGSTSIHVPIEPREVQVRLRYHRDGELALEPRTVFNVVQAGAPHSNRSFLVYGVFDETNQRVQWRGRHLFPTIRNHHARQLGLTREFIVQDQRYGTAEVADEDNPYGYGVDCPDAFESTSLSDAGSGEPAVFNTADLPLDASTESTVCGVSTVVDATGTFTTDAFARKNPEVRPAFPLLRSPVDEATRLDFFVGPCNREIDADHEEMQRQRLLMDDAPTFCSDNWQQGAFVDELTAAMADAVETERAKGNDMVLVVGVHRDEVGVAVAVEEALAQLTPEERHRSSPRLVGAFVLDSDIRVMSLPELEPVTLWCPAGLGEGASTRSCAIAPVNPDLELGPFSFGTLPILPSRDLYLDFIETYSKRQAGKVLTQTFLTPEFATTTDHIDLGTFGSITFLNDEHVSTRFEDAFSYCAGEDPVYVYFTSAILSNPDFMAVIVEDCESGALDPTFCETAGLGVLPLDFLPTWHSWFGETEYDLGLYWDFPFLLQMEYEAVLGGSVGAFGFSVPFGIATDGEQYLGSFQWENEEFSLEDELTQCTRFCDNPTFGSGGVYHVTDPFRDTYANSCYQPNYPELGDTGYPRDP